MKQLKDTWQLVLAAYVLLLLLWGFSLVIGSVILAFASFIVLVCLGYKALKPNEE